jgi:ribokinase
VSHLLLQNEIPLESTIEYLSAAYSHNVVSVMNPSPIPPTADIQRFPWDKLSWLIVNQGEASSLLEALGSGDVTLIPELPEDWPRDNVSVTSAYKTVFQLTSLPLFGPHVNIVCTLGALGILALIPSIDEPLYLPAAKLRGPVIDTTGAGDCFAGYLVAGLMELNLRGGVYSGGKMLTAKDDIVELLRHCVQVGKRYL